MSGIFDQVINYAPPSLLKGTVTYKGTWSAATNTPTLINPPDSTTNGFYYVVSAAGTQFSLVFNINDWIISNGSAWEKVDNTDAVSSVFGRTGAVVGVSTDYSAVGITATAVGASSPSTGAFTTLSATTPLAVASGGTGVASSTGTTNVVLSGSPTITTPVIAQINDAAGNATVRLTGITSATDYLEIKNGIGVGSPLHVLAEGTSANIGMHLQPKGTGLLTISDGVDFNKGIRFRSVSSAASAVTLIDAVSTAGRVITLPDATDTLVGKATTDTLTNKTLTSPTITGGALNGTLGATTPSSVAATTGTFSSTLGVTGVATLGNGAILGTPASGTVTNLTGTASININGTVGATTAAAGSFTTLAASGAFTNTQARTKASLTSSTGTNDVTISLTNTGGRLDLGRENSAGTEFGLPAYSSALYSGGAYDLYLGANGVPTAVKITSTGLNSTAIGATTPSTGAFSTLSATGEITSTTTGQFFLNNTPTTQANYMRLTNTSGNMYFGLEGATPILGGTAYDTVLVGKTGLSLSGNDGGGTQLRVTSAGAAITGTLSCTTGANFATSSGSVGIATTIPNYLLTVKGTSSATTPIISVTDAVSASGKHLKFGLDTSTGSGFGWLQYTHEGTAHEKIKINPSGGSVELCSGTTVASSTGLAVTGTLSATTTITATGSIFTGTTAEISPTSGTQDGMSLNSAGLLTISRNGAGAMQVRRRASDGNLQVFFRDTTSVGSIQVTTTGTTFTTTSDYRLKNITGPLTDSGTFIDALKPKTGTWKSNNSKFSGFLAHEFAEISPSSVAGEKDATDADGQPSYQSMQASSPEVIANLVAELQSLRKRLAALESK